MTEHPILFKGDMVRAILDGQKRQTRRVIKPQPHPTKPDCGIIWPKDREMYHRKEKDVWCFSYDGGFCYGAHRPVKCPYGVPGDLLWVRETFQPLLAKGIEIDEREKYDYKTGRGYKVNYVADGKVIEWIDADDHISQRCTPSIFMPKWACRIWLKVKAVRVERVQEITHCNIYKEGLTFDESDPRRYPQQFKRDWVTLWDSINKKRGFGWTVNPWVWVVEFEKQEQ